MGRRSGGGRRSSFGARPRPASRPASRPAARPAARPASPSAVPRPSGSSSNLPAPRPSAAKAPTPAKSSSSTSTPAPKTSAPPPAQPSSGGGMMSGMGSTLMQGMAFGAGSAVAHRAIGAAAGALGGGGGGGEQVPQETLPSDGRAVAQNAQEMCQFEVNDFYKCLEEKQNDIASCQFYFDVMQQCRSRAMQPDDE